MTNQTASVYFFRLQSGFTISCQTEWTWKVLICWKGRVICLFAQWFRASQVVSCLPGHLTLHEKWYLDYTQTLSHVMIGELSLNIWPATVVNQTVVKQGFFQIKFGLTFRAWPYTEAMFGRGWGGNWMNMCQTDEWINSVWVLFSLMPKQLQVVVFFKLFKKRGISHVSKRVLFTTWYHYAVCKH